jgi:hypothetical protein
MRKGFGIIVLIAAVAGLASGQNNQSTGNDGGSNPRLERFQENFREANLQTKREILRAAAAEDPGEFGPLYGQALRYVVSNAEDLDAEPLLREIALTVIDRIEEGEYEEAVPELWSLFRVYEDTSARIEIANAIGRLADSGGQTVMFMNEWVATQNNLSRGGTRPDFQVMGAVVTALGRIGAPSSFEPLLDAILVRYPDFVTSAARESIDMLDGDPLELAAEFIMGSDIPDAMEPFRFFMNDPLLNDQAKLRLARRTLRKAVQSRPSDLSAQEAARQLRFEAAEVLREGEYSEASPTVIEHFNETVLEYDRGTITKNRLLEAIATLGSMGTEQAAIRLTDYLELLNTYTEIDRPYDTQVMLATIRNLERLSRPVASDALFYTTLLESYPDRVRTAAREAMQSVSQ